MKQIHWQDRFGIGVELIDSAHRQLFDIVEKIMELYVERHEDRFACIEGIKYFKAYAVKHFAEEEAYMREIRYPGYLVHKRLHDRMKRETLPALEEALYASDFSTEAVQRFIGVCTGWLTGHILIEDRAITGRTSLSFRSVRRDDELSVIQAVITRPLEEMFGGDIQYLGRFTGSGGIVDAQYYELTYRSRQREPLRFVLVIGEPLLLRVAGLMFGIDFYARDEIVRFALQEIAQNLIQRAEAGFGEASDLYQLAGDRFLDHTEYVQTFQDHASGHSLLFGAGQERFALRIDRLPEDG